MGIAFQFEGKLDDAIDAFSRAIIFQPDSADARFGLAVVLERADRLDDSLQQYLATLANDQNYAKAYDGIGTVLVRKGQYETALHAFQQAVSMAPNDADAQAHLAHAEAIMEKMRAGRPPGRTGN